MIGWQNAIFHALARDDLHPSGRNPFGSTMNDPSVHGVTREDVDRATEMWGRPAAGPPDDDSTSDST